jgi:hypothetical protein
MNKRGKKRKSVVELLIVCIVTGCIIVIFAAYYRIFPYATLEYNDELSTQLFTDREGRFLSDYSQVPKTKGLHVLFLRARGNLGVPVLLRVEDTTVPRAEPVPSVLVPLGKTISPDQLITDVRDNDIVQIYFESEADFRTIGAHHINVIVEDMSGNKTAIPCRYDVRGVEQELTMEAGADLPDLSDYLICDPAVTHPEIASPYTDEIRHHTGTYDVIFTFWTDGFYQKDIAYLTVMDTVAPSGEGTFLTIVPGNEIRPESFVQNVHDETDMTFEYEKAPDLNVHEEQTVVVRVTDEGGNSTDITSTLIATTIPPITVEARNQPLKPEDFGLSGETIVESFVPDNLGTYLVKMWIDGKEEASFVTVEDTTPPKISICGVGTIYVNHPLEPDELFSVEDVFDATIQFASEPNWAEAGKQKITVYAEDANGNRAERTETIKLVADKEPPVIYGVIPRNVYKGESIAYLAEVFAEDNVDGRVDITVDSKVVNGMVGRYLVTYTATDICGNSTSKKCYYTVVEPRATEEQLHTLAKSVIDQIITPEMVMAEKLNAVFYYVRNRVKYNGSSNKMDWRFEAVRGISKGMGDCFTVYSVTKALLDELGVQYMSVKRQSSQSRHYWVIVNIGTGWYHFDPLYIRKLNFCCFMWTNRQCAVKSYYWRFDHSKYPEIATERFDYNAVVAAEKAGLLP